MSELQSIAEQLRAIAQQSGSITNEVEGVAVQLRRITERVVALKRSGVDVGSLAEAISVAEVHAEKAADAVRIVGFEGADWADQMARGVAFSASIPNSPPSPSEAESSVYESGLDRYLHPGESVETALQEAVNRFGRTNPDEWIHLGNPNYSTGHPQWTNNCGSCARAFADTFQGDRARAAFGDRREPPGEFVDVMWDILGVPHIPTVSCRPDQTVGDFTNDLYTRFENALRSHPPGAVAIVLVEWASVSPLAHWFNAYVAEDGAIHWADMQCGMTSKWPPAYSTPIEAIAVAVRDDYQSGWKELSL